SASPMAVRRIAGPRPRPAVGDPETWEGPAAMEVASSGSGSMIGSVGIESGSIAGIVLVSCLRLDRLADACRPPNDTSGADRMLHNGSGRVTDTMKLHSHAPAMVHRRTRW